MTNTHRGDICTHLGCLATKARPEISKRLRRRKTICLPDKQVFGVWSLSKKKEGIWLHCVEPTWIRFSIRRWWVTEGKKWLSFKHQVSLLFIQGSRWRIWSSRASTWLTQMQLVSSKNLLSPLTRWWWCWHRRLQHASPSNVRLFSSSVRCWKWSCIPLGLNPELNRLVYIKI